MALRQTIYQALCTKLGRIPTNAELKADLKRILTKAIATRWGPLKASSTVNANVNRNTRRTANHPIDRETKTTKEHYNDDESEL